MDGALGPPGGGGARCPAHDLALSPAGECVLCRRASAPVEDAPARGSTWTGALVGLGLVLAMAAFVIGSWPRGDVPAAPFPVSSVPEVAVPEVAAPAAPAAPRPSDGWPDREPWREREAWPEREAPAPVQPAAPPPVRAAPEPPDHRALVAARRRVSVIVYSTSWCGACRATRAFLDRLEGVSCVEHDIERDARARERMRALNPRGSIPTIDVEGRVFVGLSPRALEAAIDDAARRRL